MDKDRISIRFDHAASTYDQYAVVQKAAAQKLAMLIKRHWPHASSILEIGCGTGNLTTQLIESHPRARILATDISPAMLEMCRSNLQVSPPCTVSYDILDGEYAQADGFDLVVSSLAFQWFQDPLGACRRLREQGSALAIATLVEGTFAEWKAAYAQLGMRDGVLPFISEKALSDLTQELGGKIIFETLTEQFPTPVDFVRALKSIGAHTPRTGHQPTPLGRVLRLFPHGITVSYRLAYVLLGTLAKEHAI